LQLKRLRARSIPAVGSWTTCGLWNRRFDDVTLRRFRNRESEDARANRQASERRVHCFLQAFSTSFALAPEAKTPAQIATQTVAYMYLSLHYFLRTFGASLEFPARAISIRR
jgi:hypothetical protein